MKETDVLGSTWYVKEQEKQNIFVHRLRNCGSPRWSGKCWASYSAVFLFEIITVYYHYYYKLRYNDLNEKHQPDAVNKYKAGVSHSNRCMMHGKKALKFTSVQCYQSKEFYFKRGMIFCMLPTPRSYPQQSGFPDNPDCHSGYIFQMPERLLYIHTSHKYTFFQLTRIFTVMVNGATVPANIHNPHVGTFKQKVQQHP